MDVQASRPFTTVGVVKGSVPTSPTYSKQAWPTLKKKTGAEPNLAPYMAYATPSSGAVDLWKKLARKAELELNLEVDCHRADNAKNSATIHRISRRLIPLEKAYGKAKEALKHQEKIICFLKGQLMAVDERKNLEISYLRSQIETFQKKMAGTVQTNEQKILELQEELHQADSRAGTLQAQITEIYKNVDDEPDTMDGSGSRGGSPDSQKDGMDSKRNVQRQNKQNLGLGAVAKIHKMRLSRQYIKEKLKESEEEIVLLVQENDRLRKLAQDSVGRSNKFLDLAQTLKADRDLTMSRLQATEDIVKSVESLKNLVDSYLKTSSPRLGNFLPGSHFNKQQQKGQENPLSAKKTEENLQLEATGLATMKAGCHTRNIYSQDDVRPGTQSIGESLVKQLQDVFQVLAYKVETANQTAKTVKKEGEKIRLTMLEAFQELRGQKGAKLNTADDVALGVLIAVRDVKHTLEELEKEKALLKASESVEDEKILLLESQVHELSMDKLALLEFLESVKSTIRAANSGQGVIPYMKGLFDRAVIRGENVHEVLAMIGKLISERNEARSTGGGLLEDKLLKEKELNDLRKLYAQSQTLTTHLQVEKDHLKKERNELKANCDDLKRQKCSWDAEKKGEHEKKMLELKSQIQDLILDRAALLETLDAIKNALVTSKTGTGDMLYIKGFLKRSVVQGRNVSDVVDMVEEFATERKAANLRESRLMEERDLKERELDETKKVLAQSQGQYVILEEENKSLYSKLSELQRSTHALRTENESINAFSVEMEKRLSESRNQILLLTQERDACKETLKTLKRTFRAADSSSVTQHSEDFLDGSSEGESGSVLLEMVEKLVKERNDARSGGRISVEQLEIKDKEISDLRQSYAESKRLSESLQNDKDELEKDVKKLRNTFRTIRRSISGDCSLDSVPSEPLISGDLPFENMINEVSVIKEKLNEANLELERDRRVFERIFRETNSKVPGEGRQASDRESDASVIISSFKALHAEKQQIAAVVKACTELHCVLNNDLKKLFKTMISTEAESTSLMEDSHELTAQELIKEGSDFRKMVNGLPSVVEEVAKLKTQKITLERDLQSLELQKEDAVRRSSEHLDKMLKLSDCSQQEVNRQREQLNAVGSLVSSVSLKRTLSSNDTRSKQNVNQTELIMDLEGIIKEVVALRADKTHLEAAVSELRSKGGSEQEKMQDLVTKLSSAEALVKTLSVGAEAAESKLERLESQLAAAAAQLSELLVVLLSKDRIPGSSSGVWTKDMDVGAVIQNVQNRVFELLSARDEELSKGERESTKWKTQQEALEGDLKLSTAEIERLRVKANGLEGFVKTHTAEWTSVVESLKREIFRLGGFDPKDEGEILRKSLAMEKVKELVSPALTRIASTSGAPTPASLTRIPSTTGAQTSTDSLPSGNPLLSLGTFQVDLLVNNKVHSQLQVSGHNGGLCQAVLHYFNVNAKTGDVTFENAVVPGSQSSNLVVDVFMQPVDSKKGYQTQAGDVLGLRVKFSASSDRSTREILHNSSIIRTDEVLDAIHGQMIQNFSLWPDIVSSWRWERDAKKTSRGEGYETNCGSLRVLYRHGKRLSSLGMGASPHSCSPKSPWN